jgi:hypothetical protein
MIRGDVRHIGHKIGIRSRLDQKTIPSGHFDPNRTEWPESVRARRWRGDVNIGGHMNKSSVANFPVGHAAPMDMTGFIPPTNRIAVLGTLRLSSATGLSESCA